MLLVALAPRLAPSDRDRALAAALGAARAIEDEQSRAGALAALAPHLAPSDRDRAIAEALAAARAVEDEQSRSGAFRRWPLTVHKHC